MDEQQRANIHDDLKGVIKGDLLFDELSRVLYSTDASIFQVEPSGVVVPRDEQDVQTLVRYAAEHKVPIIPRGAGSGLAGEALGDGIVVDLSRYFRSILATGPDTVRVQPGVVYRDLNLHLEHVGRRLAPDPASGVQCTIGGMVATNASGARALKHGYTRDYVAGLRIVLDTGDAADTSRHSLDNAAALPAGHLGDISAAVAELLKQHQALIRTCRPRTPYNRFGYVLHDVLHDGDLDLPRLLVGSEGTLALFTEVTLRTIPLPGGRSLVLLAFAGLDAAIRAAQQALPSGPAACDLLDHRLLTLARGGDPVVARLVPPGAEVVLLVEYEAATATEAREAGRELFDRLYRTERLALHAAVASEPADIDRLWRLRESALPNLYGLRGGAHPVPLIEDVAVPVQELHNYLHQVQEILQQHETTASFLVHAGTGQVHARPFLDLERPEDVAKLWTIADKVHNLALDLGGTISTQHGTGLARTPWVARQYGPLFPVFRDLKAIFDPNNLFNPGKIVGPDCTPTLRTGRHSTLAASPGAPHHWLHWEPGEARSEIARCNGCGQCRTEAAGQRMCPVFRATHAEAATPRAKANLLRHLLENDTDSRQLSSDDVRAVADLCVNCKMCALECPAHVNIPKLMLEAKAANVAEHGLNRSDWVLARTESFAAIGSALSFVVNAALASGTIRWLLEKLFGVARKRRLPTFAPRSFLRLARQRGWTQPPQAQRPRVAYFVDVFANYNDPQIAEAVVAVLHHNGIEVFVPPGQVGSGMAPLAQGDMETAREMAQINLRVLTDLAREGYRILCSEPTAALMLRHDYLDILDDPDARLIANQTVELTAFLWELYRQDRLRTDFLPLDYCVGHHVPCHLKALGPLAAGPALLALIPGLRVHTIDVSCSGMAGTFGLKAENYAVSLLAGKPMLEELGRAAVRFGSTECSTCRMQMEDGGKKRTLHPVQYLALAYGLMPDLARRLEEPIRELVLQ